MPARRPMVGGNWKMNTDLASAVELAEDVAVGCDGLIQDCDVAVFPPFPYLQAVGKALGHHAVALGAQDVYHEPNGAFTGEVSTDMLLDLHATIALVGHSERRHVVGETDELVNAKLLASLAAGLGVVLCVGETMEQREAGQTETVTVRQLRAGLEGAEPEHLRRVVIAYEPVWAIGTGHTASPEDAQAVHRCIRDAVRSDRGDAVADGIRIQYGGSVKPGNAAELMGQEDVDGFLVGGASLKADDFIAIVRAAASGAGRTGQASKVRNA